MALKLYNETDIEAIADAIRGKNGSSDTYTVSQMAQAIDDIPSGGGGGGSEAPVLYWNGTSTAGTMYGENTVIDSGVPYYGVKKLTGAQHLKSVKCLRTEAYGGDFNNRFEMNEAFKGCSLLESVQLLNGLSTSGYCEDIIKDCPNIKEFITGDIGFPNTVGMGTTSGSYLTFRDITIEFDIIIYTTATTLATVPSYLKTGSPWGATNATIIYKNSVTGEVLT